MPHSLLLRLSVCAAASFAAQACYNYVPLESTPPIGDRVALEITDRGRVALADRFGPGIESIEGRLLENQPNEYVISVSRVTQISGSSAIWSGEQTHVSRELVGSVRRRELSKARTALLVGGIAAGVVALAAHGLAGSGSEKPETSPLPPPASVRIPIPFHP